MKMTVLYEVLISDIDVELCSPECPHMSKISHSSNDDGMIYCELFQGNNMFFSDAETTFGKRHELDVKPEFMDDKVIKRIYRQRGCLKLASVK